MEYKRFIDDVSGLEFIKGRDMAEDAVKAVLGILASTMHEPQARKFTSLLPGPLTYERLVGHQKRPEFISIDEYSAELSAQFNIDREQARRLLDTVFRTAKEAIGEDTVEDLEDDMPPEVAEELENV